MESFADYNPLAPSVRRDPYPYYAHLRKHEPVKYLPGLQAFAVSRHEDVRAVLLDHELFSSEPLIQIAFGAFNPAPGATYMIATDPPDHSRLRALVNKAFSRRYVAELRDEIAAREDEFLDRFEDGREFDFAGTFAAPLPVSVIADMLGVEAGMHTSFRRWSNNVTAGGNAEALTDSQREQFTKDAEEFRAYFLDRIEHARRRPGDDLISALVTAESQEGKLSADEILAMCVLLLIAGNETTTNLLSNLMVCMAEFPDQEAAVRADRSLMPKLLEESLRYLSPVQLIFRKATRDTEIAGVPVAKDAIVLPMFASANRDASAFSDPDRIDVHREDLRGHLAFGWGVHMCVGKALSLLEGEIAVNALFDRFSRFEVATSDIEWCDAFYLRGPKALSVRCTKTRS
jgi:cytochrome P450